MRKAENLPPSCAIVTKSGNLNFLEPSGPLRAYNGTDFIKEVRAMRKWQDFLTWEDKLVKSCLQIDA